MPCSIPVRRWFRSRSAFAPRSALAPRSASWSRVSATHGSATSVARSMTRAGAVASSTETRSPSTATIRQGYTFPPTWSSPGMSSAIGTTVSSRNVYIWFLSDSVCSLPDQTSARKTAARDFVAAISASTACLKSESRRSRLSVSVAVWGRFTFTQQSPKQAVAL